MTNVCVGLRVENRGRGAEISYMDVVSCFLLLLLLGRCPFCTAYFPLKCNHRPWAALTSGDWLGETACELSLLATWSRCGCPRLFEVLALRSPSLIEKKSKQKLENKVFVLERPVPFCFQFKNGMCTVPLRAKDESFLRVMGARTSRGERPKFRGVQGRTVLLIVIHETRLLNSK